MFKKALKYLQKIEDSVLVVTFSVMVISFFMQVINRNVIKASVSWFEELSRYCMMYMAFLGAEAGLRDGTQISVSALTDKLPPFPRALVLLVARLIVIIFAVVIFVTSLSMLRLQIRSGQLSPALKIPMIIPYFSITFSFGIICGTQIAQWIVIFLLLVKEGANASEGRGV